MAFDQTSGLRGYPEVGPMRPMDAAALDYGSQTRARTAGLRNSLRMSPYTPPPAAAAPAGATPAQGLNAAAAESAQAARPANALSRGLSAVKTGATAAKNFVTGIPGAAGRGLSSAVTRAAPWVAPLAEGADVAKVALDKNSSGLDVATQAAEGTGKAASAYLLAQGGAAVGALGGPLAPLTVPLGAVAGGLAGYYGADKMIRLGREEFAPNSVASPVEQIQQRETAAPAVPPVAPSVAGAPDPSDARFARSTPVDSRAVDKYLASGGVRGTLPRDLSMLNEGSVYKTVDPKTGRTVYSGVNVKENANIVDSLGAKTGQLNNDLRGQGVLAYDSNGKTVVAAASPGGTALGPGTLRASAQNPGPMMPVSQSFGDGGVTAGTPGGGLGGFGDSSRPTLQTKLESQLETALGQAKNGRMFRDRQAGARAAEALVAQLTGMQTAAGHDAASLEGHRISGEYGLRGAMVQAGATGRAAMLEYMQKQLDRRAVADAYRRGGRGGMADILTGEYGMLDTAGKALGNEQTRVGTESTAQSTSSARDAQARQRYEDTTKLLAPYYTTGKDEKTGAPIVDGAAVSEAVRMLNENTQGRFDSLDQNTKLALVNQVVAQHKAMSGGLDRRAKGYITDAFTPDAAFSRDEQFPVVRDARVGGVKDIFSDKAGVGYGAIIVTDQNGNVRAIPRDVVRGMTRQQQDLILNKATER